MKRTRVLELAAEVISESRNNAYGEPEVNQQRIADFWNLYLKEREVVSPSDACVMMILVKIARLMHDPTNIDTWIDIAGYAAIGCEVME